MINKDADRQNQSFPISTILPNGKSRTFEITRAMKDSQRYFENPVISAFVVEKIYLRKQPVDFYGTAEQDKIRK